MRHLLFSVVFLALAVPGQADTCGSLVTSVCETAVSGAAPVRKVLKVKPTVTAFSVGDRFPYETQSLLMDPTRYNLKPSDGTWRYYSKSGVVYRVETQSGLVLEVIRSRQTAHLR